MKYQQVRINNPPGVTLDSLEYIIIISLTHFQLHLIISDCTPHVIASFQPNPIKIILIFNHFCMNLLYSCKVELLIRHAAVLS